MSHLAWNTFTWALVCGPKSPSTTSVSPSARRARCRVLTRTPESPSLRPRSRWDWEKRIVQYHVRTSSGLSMQHSKLPVNSLIAACVSGP